MEDLSAVGNEAPDTDPDNQLNEVTQSLLVREESVAERYRTEKPDTQAINALEPEPQLVPPQSTSDLDARSQELRSRWNLLSASFDSLSGALISAGDLRRSIIEKRQLTLQKIEAFLASPEPLDPQALRDSILELQNAERNLQEKDVSLVEKGYEVVTQGSKLFGPTADSSLEILDLQALFVQAEDTDSEDSFAPTDDIRLDQNPLAQEFLSKKGDVDLLRESLAELDAERVMISSNEDVPYEEHESLEVIESKRREIMQQLEKAEVDLGQLRDNLPDRDVSIPPDQLRPPGEDDNIPSFQSPAEQTGDEQHGTDAKGDSHSAPGHHPESLQNILQTATEDETIKPNTLVNAYLLYQLRLSAEEQARFSKVLQDAAPESSQQVEGDLTRLPLEHWFEEEARSSRENNHVQDMLSRSFATATDSHHSYQMTHGKSEPKSRRRPPQFHTGDDLHRLTLFAEGQVNGTSSLR